MESLLIISFLTHAALSVKRFKSSRRGRFEAGYKHKCRVASLFKYPPPFSWVVKKCQVTLHPVNQGNEPRLSQVRYMKHLFIGILTGCIN